MDLIIIIIAVVIMVIAAVGVGMALGVLTGKKIFKIQRSPGIRVQEEPAADTQPLSSGPPKPPKLVPPQVPDENIVLPPASSQPAPTPQDQREPSGSGYGYDVSGQPYVDGDPTVGYYPGSVQPRRRPKPPSNGTTNGG